MPSTCPDGPASSASWSSVWPHPHPRRGCARRRRRPGAPSRRAPPDRSSRRCDPACAPMPRPLFDEGLARARGSGGFVEDKAPLCGRTRVIRKAPIRELRPDETDPVGGRRSRRCSWWPVAALRTATALPPARRRSSVGRERRRGCIGRRDRQRRGCERRYRRRRGRARRLGRRERRLAREARAAPLAPAARAARAASLAREPPAVRPVREARAVPAEGPEARVAPPPPAGRTARTRAPPTRRPMPAARRGSCWSRGPARAATARPRHRRGCSIPTAPSSIRSPATCTSPRSTPERSATSTATGRSPPWWAQARPEAPPTSR